MFPKIIKFSGEGRTEINKGVNILANAVKSTLGPQGRNVLIGNKGMKVRFTKDGVSVAKEVCLYDEIQDAGVNIIREVSINTCNTVGDGTTTATVIAQNIINQGIEYIECGFNPVGMKAGLETALEKVISFLKFHAKEITSDEEIINIATIAANGDRSLGEIIADTFKKVGKDGVITLEDSASGKTESSIVEGLQMDKGFITPYFVTNFAKMTCELDDPYILIYDKKISTLQPMLPLLEAIARSNQSLLIIAEDVDHEALGTLVKNRNVFKVAAIKSPSHGNQRIDLISDLSVMTGALVASEDTGVKLDGIHKEMLGRAKKIIITQDKTTIIGGYGDKDKVQARCDYLREEIENPDNVSIKNDLEQRLAKLTNGIAIIKIGGNNDLDIKERKDRVEDAVHATRAALMGGILPGGGISLLKASKYISSLEFLNQIDNHGKPKFYDASFTHGIYLLEQALKAPFNQILENAGIVPEEIIEKIDAGADILEFGYDASNFECVNMLEAGIIDPFEVVQTCLKDAVSIASLLLTTEVVMIEENEITLNSLQAPSNPYKIRM